MPANRHHADRLISQARKHLSSAAEICDEDPPGGYALVYDAARKALTALPENRGLRPTTRGGHLAAHVAVRAQLDRMRRQRHDAEYPPSNAPALTADDVREDVLKAADIVSLAERVLDQMSPF